MQENDIIIFIKDVKFEKMFSKDIITIKISLNNIKSFNFIESYILQKYLNNKYKIIIHSVISFVIFNDMITISYEYTK